MFLLYIKGVNMKKPLIIIASFIFLWGCSGAVMNLNEGLIPIDEGVFYLRYYGTPYSDTSSYDKQFYIEIDTFDLPPKK
jgi:hypothetical protein